MTRKTLREFFRTKKEVVAINVEEATLYAARYKRWYHIRWVYIGRVFNYRTAHVFTWHITQQKALEVLNRKFPTHENKHKPTVTVVEQI